MTDDLRSLRPLATLDRRGFVTTALAGGFAVATLPVSAETLVTPSEGLDVGEVRIPVADGSLPAYYARPARGSKLPVVLVVQEIFGVHEHIRDVCRRFAQRGAIAVAPELFARQGDPSKVADIQALMRDIVSKVPDAQVMADLDATLQWARARARGVEGKVGVTGFCWGGRITWLYAAHSPEVAAEAAASQIVVYPEAGHGFYADYRASYRREDAEAAFAQAIGFFASRGLMLQAASTKTA